MVAEVLKDRPDLVRRATLVPSSGGIFEVRADGRTIYSNRETGRFPNPGEILPLLT